MLYQTITGRNFQYPHLRRNATGFIALKASARQLK